VNSYSSFGLCRGTWCGWISYNLMVALVFAMLAISLMERLVQDTYTYPYLKC
jgi:hypothetical protein